MKKISALLLFVFIAFTTFSQSGSEAFTSSGSFTVPAGVTLITVEVLGAGGSGGINGTGGGGGGGYASGEYAVTPLEILAVTIGEPGDGSDEGTTSVSDLISATGGENGVSVPNPEIGGGGEGGVGSGGNISNYNGGNGGGGYYTYFGGGGGGAAGPLGNGTDGGNTIAWTGICETPGGDGGASGGDPGGNGGKGAGFTDAFCTVTDPAAVGLNYGGGGGGGNGNGGGPEEGAAGYCIIKWCSVDITTSLTGETISATAADASYQWIDCNNGNSAIAGETGQSFTALENGSYAVIISEAACSDTSACVDITSIIPENIVNAYHMMIYANPFTYQIIIQNTTGNEYYTLINVSGQVMWSGKYIAQQDFSTMISGIYFLKVRNENTTQTIKLIKQ
ncbi:MAG: T9SS type A sorting domain-containing protein [Chitinophagales bacterium]|nr:T9SS type A sorting domain-containing protein [Chitinophagales bacterium]